VLRLQVKLTKENVGENLKINHRAEAAKLKWILAIGSNEDNVSYFFFS